MSKKMLACIRDFGAGSWIQLRKYRRHLSNGCRQRSVVAITSPGQYAYPQASRPSDTNWASDWK